jgi:hypothetical protein
MSRHPAGAHCTFLVKRASIAPTMPADPSLRISPHQHTRPVVPRPPGSDGLVAHCLLSRSGEAPHSSPSKGSMDALRRIDRLGRVAPLLRHRFDMLPRLLLRGFGVTVLIPSIAILGAFLGHAGGGRAEKPGSPSAQARASAGGKLAAEVRNINRASVGETRVAAFLGAEFGMSEEAIIKERRTLGASWGNLTIAHTLAASDKQGMTVAQVLHLSDCGLGWGQIAVGLGFNLDDTVRAVSAESRVARGRAKADGKAAPIRSGQADDVAASSL